MEFSVVSYGIHKVKFLAIIADRRDGNKELLHYLDIKEILLRYNMDECLYDKM